MTVHLIFPKNPTSKPFEPRNISPQRLYEAYQHLAERCTAQKTKDRQTLRDQAYARYQESLKSEGK